MGTRLTKADRILFGILALAALLSYFTVGEFLEQGSGIEIEVDQRLVYRTDLGHDQTFGVAGVKGEMEFEVSEKGIRVVKSDCPNQVCVRMGWRNRAGDVIVCVPNRMIARITGRKESGVSGVTG